MAEIVPLASAGSQWDWGWTQSSEGRRVIFMKLILASDASKVIEAVGSLTELRPSERGLAAGKKFGLFVGLALLSAPIPVLHMVSVPTFLLLSLVTAGVAYSRKWRLTLADARCASCSKELGNEHFLTKKLRVKCEGCFAQYLVRS